ncbi:MAG: hypothetical protein ACLS20_06520 [Faecalimonas umbilicata]|uniref:hypothetical protein n=1 Tax=Faecalimonas umbilicata TaxID=1912855 RepID=UPI0039937B70
MENNITVNMENLSEEEREQLMKLIEKSNGSKRNVWKPEGNEKYFFVSGCGVINSCKWINDTTDNGYYEIGNCFKTKEEAEFALEKRRVEVELHRFAEENNECKIDWKDENQNKYYMYYNNVTGEIEDSVLYRSKIAGVVYFSSIKILEQAIQVIGKGRLKKYYLGIEE